jgi:tRNA-2-methylthio-N6-dimethylallyladenosine synthase
MKNGKKRAYICTWGCQMNEHKSEGIAGLLAGEGYELARAPEEADLVIFNTCMVREKPVDKLYSEAGIIRELKAQNPELLLGVGGCVAQALGEKLFDRNDAIDFVFGSSNISEIPQLIEQTRLTRQNSGRCAEPVMAIEKIPDRIEDLPFVRQSSFQAKVTITEGCSNFCSFCIVPYTTGLLRSRLPGEILREVRVLANQRYLEVQLLGQNVDSYGRDLDDPEINFANLLRAIAQIDISRVRFTSSHPKDITPDVIEVLGEPNNICEHVHMAVQAGSDRVLKAMRRGYTKEQFLDLVERIRARVPDVSITTDIIVGFPGETEEDFLGTVDLVERARFGGAYIFKYSPRPGTISFYKYEDDVPTEEKQRRLAHLLDIQKRITQEENLKRVGRTVEVLIEGAARGGPNRLRGKTRDNRTLVLAGPLAWTGKLIQTRVTDADIGGLYGEVDTLTRSNVCTLETLNVPTCQRADVLTLGEGQ